MNTTWRFKEGNFDLEKNDIKKSETIIKVLYSCICGTDIHNIEKMIRQNNKNSIYLGHELVGEIVCKEDSDDFSIGDIVVVNPGINCNECFYCKEGKDTYCNNRRTYGMSTSSELLGGFSKYIPIYKNTKLHKIPENISAKSAVLIEPIAVIVKAIERFKKNVSDINSKIAIVGLGPIGVITKIVLDYNGYGNIDLFECNKKRIEIIKKLYGFVSSDLSDKAVFTEEHKFDVVFDCSGTESGWKNSVDLAKKGGTIIEIGQFVSNDINFDLSVICKKDLRIVGSSLAGNEHYISAFNLLSNKSLGLEKLITDEFDFELLDKAVEKAKSKNCLKVIIKNW